MRRTACARIDLSALRHNLSTARRAAPASRVMAVIKADAYGHGMVAVARALAGDVEAFAVSCLDEAHILREAGVSQPLVALQGFRDGAQLREAVALGVRPVIHEHAQLICLETTALSAPVPVWLKLDTGMHRLGFAPAEAAGLQARLAAMPQVAGEPGLMTHLACADEPARGESAAQLKAFEQAAVSLPGERSMANSAAILSMPASHGDWVRPGIMLYGASPLVGEAATQLNLNPVMTVSAPVVALKTLKQGDAVGYGGSYICQQPRTMAVVAMGYGDGYPRHAPSGTPVLVRGRRCGLMGRVSMDLLSVDVSDVPGVQVGDAVTLWGEGLPVDEIAAAAATISYELLCAVGGRLRMEYVE
ncbi:MAG: alanine racemase [Thioalkalivibrio sp.]